MTTSIIHDEGDLVAETSLAIEAILREALASRGKASLMVSGGNSPKPLYQQLSKADLDWSNVTISLVDERWVDSGQSGSNEDFIKQNLIQNNAKKSRFFGLKTPHKTVEEGLAEAEARFAETEGPFDVCVMGMGSDAHTASWFPNSSGLSTALDTSNDKNLCAIDAQGSPVAGDFPDRITLTLNSVINSHAIILFIPGEAKRVVFDDAPSKPVSDAPVQALLKAGSKLHIFASPAP